MIERLANIRRVARLKDNIPETVGEAVALFHPFRAVVIKVVALDVAEIRASKVVEMHRVMDPLLEHITLYNPRQKNRERVDRRDKAYRSRNEEQRKKVPQFAVDVVSIKGPGVMFPMERVQTFVQELPDNTLARSKAPVQDKAVEQILDKGPNRETGSVKKQSDEWMPRAKREKQHGHGIGCIKDGHRVQAVPGNARLLALVNAKRNVCIC